MSFGLKSPPVATCSVASKITLRASGPLQLHLSQLHSLRLPARQPHKLTVQLFRYMGAFSTPASWAPNALPLHLQGLAPSHHLFPLHATLPKFLPHQVHILVTFSSYG